MSTTPHDERHPLFDRAREAPLPEVRLDRVQARLRDSRARPKVLLRGVAAAAAVAAAVGLWLGFEPEAPAPAPAPMRTAAPEAAPAPVEVKTPEVERADVAETVPASPRVRARAVAPRQRSVRPMRPVMPLQPTETVPEAERPSVVAPVRAPAPPSDSATARAGDLRGTHPAPRAYQPRAIREFLRVDWARWEDRELPAAVAHMVEARDAIGLLAALEALPESGVEAELADLRRDLRDQYARAAGGSDGGSR